MSLLARCVCLLLCASLLVLTNGQYTTYYLCGTLQGSAYTVIDYAVLQVNTTTTLVSDYYGNMSPAMSVVSLLGGNRTFTNLATSGSPTPVTVQMSSLAPPGSTGGNTNYLFPTVNPVLNGDGLTFNFASNITISGSSFLGNQMNLWWASGSNTLLEETQSSGHETVPMFSSVQISNTSLSCSLSSTVARSFSFCMVTNGPGYTVANSGFFNTTGLASYVAPTYTNGLNSAAQGWTVTSVSGSRTYTELSTGTVTTSNYQSIPSTGSVVSNDNFLYPNSIPTQYFDGAGVAIVVNPAAPIAGQTTIPNGTNLVLKASSPGIYYEQQNAGHPETPCSSVYAQVVPGNNLLPCVAGIAANYSYTWSVSGANYTASINGTFTINPLPTTNNGRTAYLILTVTGTRYYTNLVNGNVTVNVVTGLATAHSLGGNDNFLYIGAVSPLAPLDGDGITLNFNSVPPIYGQTAGTTQMNMWYDGPNYDEENSSGNHEQQITTSSFTFTAIPTSNPPSCPATYASVSSSSTGSITSSSTGNSASATLFNSSFYTLLGAVLLAMIALMA